MKPIIMSAPAASAVLRSILPPPDMFRESVHNFPIWLTPRQPGEAKASRLARRNRMTEGLASSIWPVHDKDFAPTEAYEIVAAKPAHAA